MTMTTRKRHSPEQVVRKLATADRMLGDGQDVADVCRELQVSERTYYRWRNQFGELKADDAKRPTDREPVIQVSAGLVVLVGPPASGKTSFVGALIARRQIDAEAVVSSDEIRAELFGTAPARAESDGADARIFEERDRRIVARLAAGQTAVAESTNVTPQARTRLIAIAKQFNAPVTMLRFNPDVPDLLEQYIERGRTDLTAEDVRAYADIMIRDASADQLRSEGATTVHDVPGRRQATTPAEAAARFSFA